MSPEIIITVIVQSSDADCLADKALVASWLTRLESP